MTEIPNSNKLLLGIMVVVLFALLLFAKGETKDDCNSLFNETVLSIENRGMPTEQGASILREAGCYDDAIKVQMYWGVETGELTPTLIDDNLTDKKDEDWWRLNSNGYSQRHLNLEGSGRQERIISLLNQYGFDGEDTWYSIRTIARIYRVYPETIVCIAYADSSLGKYLKTEHNYGNVGNNDRGDTVSYTNLEQGFNAIAKTLNNQYLGGYTTINQLSRYGNAEGKVYATSPENWHINVTNCLGMIHNKKIADDWNFRF